jgi:hypothetical protein
MRSAGHRLLLIVALAAFWTSGITAAWGSSWVPGLSASSNGEALAYSLPPQPTATATCSGVLLGSIVVTWNSVTPASNYLVYQSTSSATGPYSEVANVTSLTYTQSGLGIGSYWFEVAAAVGSNWQGAKSAATAKRSITLVLCT